MEPAHCIHTSPLLLSIEGNIGVGKSTILQGLKDLLDPRYVTCVQEPVDQWENIRTQDGSQQTILSEMFRDPSKFGFAFQIMAYCTIYQALQRAMTTHPEFPEATVPNIVIAERSPDSSYHVFTKMMHHAGTINDIEHQVFQLYTTTLSPIPIDVCIYLRSDPSICFERIQKRGRPGEQHITLDYLQTCHDAHDTWISTHPATVITIDVLNKTTYEIIDEILAKVG